MAFLLQCMLMLIFLWTSPRSSQMSCEYYSEDLPSPLYDHVAGYSASTNSMYIMGGYADDDVDYTADSAVYKWDLDADASSDWFTPISTIPDAEWASYGLQTMFPVENILYVIGVQHSAHTVNRFDTVTNQWLANGAEPPRTLRKGCIVHTGSHFVMFDGWGDSDSTQFVYIQLYDIARDVWSMHTVEAPFDTTGLSSIRWRYQFCAFVEDKLYVFGGKISGGSTGLLLDGMWRYDTLNQQFINIGTLPRPCGYGTTVFDGFSHLYLLGCNYDPDGYLYTNAISVFDANTETITADIMYSQFKIGELGAVIFNRTLWLFGGWIEENSTWGDASPKVQICDISLFLPTANPSAGPSAAPSAEPSATPTALPSSSNNDTINLLLSIIIVLIACGCFCVAVLFYVWSRNKRSDQQGEQIHMQQPAAIHQPPVFQMQQLQQFPWYPPVPPPPHYAANMNAPHQPWPQVLPPQNYIPQQSVPVQSNIVHVADDGKSEDKITAEGQADDDEKEQSKTRSSDSSIAMHDDHWAVNKVTNMNGVDDAHKLEIFEKEHGTNGPDTKGTNH